MNATLARLCGSKWNVRRTTPRSSRYVQNNRDARQHVVEPERTAQIANREDIRRSDR